MTSQIEKSRDIAARDILTKNRELGLPFLLVLRSYWGARFIRSQNIQDNLYEQLSPDFGVLSIRGQHSRADQEENAVSPEMRNRCPAFSVSDDEWFALATELIQRADFIVAEIGTDTPGVSSELRECLKQARQERTIVMLPPPQVVSLYDTSTFDGFWQIILREDFEEYSIYDHPAARDLFQEVIRWKETPPEKRGKKTPTPFPQSRPFPIIIPELVRIASAYRLRGNLNAAGVHFQTSWNIGVGLAEENAFMSKGEVEGLILAGLGLSERLEELDRTEDALAKLSVVATLASETELDRYLPTIVARQAELISERSSS
jgi:hypothetical protein